MILSNKIELDFTSYISDHTKNFTGREWVFEKIQTWLSNPNGSRYFLLTGEPGSGKTAIAARLAQFSQGKPAYRGFSPGFLKAIHFCSARDSTSSDPRRFTESLALQLAQIPEYANLLINLDTKQVNIQTVQNIGTANNATIQGVVINHLTVSGVMSAQEAFNLVFLNPLQTLYHKGFKKPITILVDSLDEALTHRGDDNIVGLLSKIPPQLNLRFLLTSRQESRVENAFLEPVDGLFLSAPEYSHNNRHDIQKYIKTRLQKKQFVTQIATLDPTQKAAQITQILDKSEGNFQYVSFLLDAVARGDRAFADLNGLPEGLDGLYYNSLERIINLGKKSWADVYAPLIGVLSVAQDSLTLNQLRAFTGQSEQTVWDCLNDLQQFLDESEPILDQKEAETQYRLYHQSVVDFLRKKTLVIHKKQARNLYYVSPIRWHQQIADYYWNQYHNHWNACERYGLRYTGYHLAETTKLSDAPLQHQYTERLVRLVTNSEFQQVHQAKLQDLSALQQDVEQALRTVTVDTDPLAVPLLIEMALASIAFRKTWLSPEPIFELARQGNVEAAEQRLNLFSTEPEWQQVALLTIAWLASQVNPTEARQLRDRIAGNLLTEETLSSLLMRLDAHLEHQLVPNLEMLPAVASPDIIQAILMRMGGMQNDELLYSAGIEPLVNPSLLLEPSNTSKERVPIYVSEQDGPLLVAYAMANPLEGNQYLQQYLDIHAAYNYREYRNRSLMVLLRAILRHPEQAWVQEVLPKVLCTALTGGNQEFRSGMSLTLLGLRGLVGHSDAVQQLEECIQSLHNTIGQMPDNFSEEDPYQEE